jgi:hypothetical protein
VTEPSSDVAYPAPGERGTAHPIAIMRNVDGERMADGVQSRRDSTYLHDDCLTCASRGLERVIALGQTTMCMRLWSVACALQLQANTPQDDSGWNPSVQCSNHRRRGSVS